MTVAAAILKHKKHPLEEGHPWVYRSDIDRVEGEAKPGALIKVRNRQGKFLATGYYNPQSQLAVRIVSHGELDEMNIAFFTERISAAKRHRMRFVQGATSYRAVYGEADFLPGLIVDKFGDVLVVQILTLGMDLYREAITAALVNVFDPVCIYERSDVGVRELEGLEQRTGLLYGELINFVQIEENGLKLEVDIVHGQKTGYFFDQRENRTLLEPLMTGWGERSGIRMEVLQDEQGVVRHVPVNRNGKEVTFPYWDGATVLECFAHTGSFTLHACKYGAKKVTCLDVSEHAINSARVNVELNGYADRVEFVVADAFAYLREQVRGLEERRDRALGKADTSKPLADGGRTWDVVILDPPAFAKSRAAVEGACRGYKDINLHALKLVNEGGYLVTASCSYHVRPDKFLSTIRSAAHDAGKLLRLIEFRGAGKDHPRILGVEEGHYLKFAIFEVRSRNA